MLNPPPRNSLAEFAPSFGQRVLLTVDTEEEFDWDGPFTRDQHGLKHVARMAEFQSFCEKLGTAPLYLVDWPIVHCDSAVELIGDALARGTAEIGIQLHPWVNPPFQEEVNERNSYAGNLPQELEREKFTQLRDAIADRFNTNPLVYRAGRYGLGPHSADMLLEAGVAIDTSVRCHFDYRPGSGPDYSRHPRRPYWVDEGRHLLELPVTTVFWGMLRKQARAIYPRLEGRPGLLSALSRLGILERIALTPEGVTSEEAIRALDMAIDDGLPIIVLSLHSPSLDVGHTPYVRSEEDLAKLYDWLRVVIGYCELRGVKPTSVAEIMQSTIV
ncbi:polysaccharide deacetylase family protein [Altererythrobacter arenosus]|uniref:Polysaccharide deacetylase family protein n=1 Tax=Altererythrobacter arenosus TaxID=3032592 RepID=A0ABY8FTV8_9SPHN|nr:polysaccharide deacetylase family protein [Altererythrobacter sp. CAU 1644]WFL77525.1 polysaccharide deacetylase family protein [Altererythrobacter sp. CAU 1644]